MLTPALNRQGYRPDRPPRTNTQRLVLWCLAVATGFGVLRGLTIQGLTVPVRVAGPSMAETLVGEHYNVTCGDCRFPFRCGSASVPATGELVCPNCGYAQKGSVPPRRGDRVLVDRLAYALRSPERGDLVALHAPDGHWSVKRIVGLPGEHVSIRQGDLCIDGRVARKSLEHFRQIATLVHDDRYRPQRSRGIPERWASGRQPSNWRCSARGYHFTPPPSSDAPTASTVHKGTADWLTYRNWRCYATPHPRTQEVPISDHSPYDQAESRELWAVADVLVACRLRLGTSAHVQVRIDDGMRLFRLQLDSRRRATLSSDDRTVHAEFGIPFRQNMLLEFGLFDQQIAVAVDGKVVALHAYRTGSGTRWPTSRPIGILGSGGPVAVEDLRIYRDVYYLDPKNLGVAWETPHIMGLSAEKNGEAFVVLGDNPHVSADSRHWVQRCIDRRQLSGKVLLLKW